MKIKVLHVLTDVNIGGAGHYLLSLLKSYDRENFRIEVALPLNSRLTPLVEALDVAVIELSEMPERSLSYHAIWAIGRIMTERRIDILHTHASLSGRIAAKLYSKPVIYTRHYCIQKSRFGAFGGFLANLFNRLLNDRVIATSPEVEKGLIEAGMPPSLITTIYNGVPPLRKFSDEEKSAALAKYGIANDAFVVSQVARLDPVKGHDHTLDAAKQLASYSKTANDPKIIILIAGDGP